MRGMRVVRGRVRKRERGMTPDGKGGGGRAEETYFECWWPCEGLLVRDLSRLCLACVWCVACRFVGADVEGDA